MQSQVLGAKYGSILGGCLVIAGIGGGVIINNSILGMIGLLGILIVFLSLSVFGLILPLAE
jgi:hypothetical protein